MCGTNDLQLDLCFKEQHEDTTTAPSRSGSSSSSSNSVEKVWKETQQLMEDCEQLVRIMTHVCSQQFSGAYRTLARYSQGCWRGCSAVECVDGRRVPYHDYVHPPSLWHHHHPSSCCGPSSSSCSYSSSSSSPCQQMSLNTSCKGCCGSCGCGESTSSTSCPSGARHYHKHQCYHLQEDEGSSSAAASSSSSCSSCRRRGGLGRRWRWRWGRCQCAHCHQGCCCSTVMGGDSGARVGHHPSSQPLSPALAKSTTTVITSTTTTTTTTTHHQCPTPCPTHATSPADAPHTSRRTSPPPSSQARAASTASPKPRGGAPSHPSILTILLLLVVTLARFTDGCSSRSTPKPRQTSPTMRPNITFQTYACPPAYAAWYCLNGATCFTVKIGESILYNCECADGYMGQRCEFKDLDGSYLPAREKVLMETASIAGGATVACVLVFIVLFAVYVFMQKDKDKRCRDIDGGRNNDRQPFSGYQNPRPEMFRTISNPYARTIDELSHVEVESAGHGNSGSGGRNGSGSTGGGNMVDSNLHGAQHQTPSPTS